MKKYVWIFIVLLICGCSNSKEEQDKEENISSTGELICIYKENRVNENTMYTSYYLFNFSEQGILKSVVNNEEIVFEDTDEEVKENYKLALNQTIKEYDDISGIKLSKKIEDDSVSFNLDMEISKMDEETINEYGFNLDRINLYKTFTNNNYTCE